MELAPSCLGSSGHLGLEVVRDLAAAERASKPPRRRNPRTNLRVKRFRADHADEVAKGGTKLSFKAWLRSLSSLDFADPTGRRPHTSSLVEKIRGRKRR